MKNKDMDNVPVRCSVCQQVYDGKYVNNPHELLGICDWCALAIMLRDAEPEEPRHWPKPSETN